MAERDSLFAYLRRVLAPGSFVPLWGVLAATWGAIIFVTAGSAWWVGALTGLFAAFVVVPFIVRLTRG